MTELKKHELDGYEWREYDFMSSPTEQRIYRINFPVTLWTRAGGETHRVLDAEGVVHLVPAPGFFGCVIRYKKKDGIAPVLF